MAYAKGSIPPGGHKALTIQLLADKIRGMTSKDIALRLGITEQRAANVCSDLAKAGHIVGVDHGVVSAARQKLWCTLEHQSSTWSAIKSAKWATTRSVEKAPSHWKKRGLGRIDHVASTPALAVKVTICDHQEDTRYTVKTAPAVFTSMGIGVYEPTGSAIERGLKE